MAKKRVLIVEDNPDISEFVSLALSNYEVEVARHVPQAIEKAEEFEPDLVLLDIRLPFVSGLDLLEAIGDGRIVQFARSRVVLMSCVTPRNGIDRRMESTGTISGYLRKPFSVFELHAAVAAAV